ncbi:jg21771 [Pararge aegeria aegeria]|uniref:Jg21771 protein n=1 Tax=Pararge aegeria aegeria TaxID=348720 RepID=A0A8S4S0K9_9NEOP|nr:jg21771 [Pararge aegeria aegeria]
MLGQIGLAFGCVNYLTTPETSGTKSTSPSRQRVHPEGAEKLTEKLAVPRKASPEDKTPSPGETIAPKISASLARECTPAESRPMTLYGYNAAARLPFTFSHARERRSLRAAPRPAPAGRMVRSASSGAAPHAPAPAPAPARPHKLVDPPPPGLHLVLAESFLLAPSKASPLFSKRS